ncbi:MAG TPA: DUF4251 domain-containing protein [Mucilaginibacter sp.]|nr:DUF4251 domain-containing protein [Mucilaginibacter sp.]
MKALRKIGVMAMIVCAVANVLNAQNRQDKKAAKRAAIKSAVETKKYTFIADYMLPQRRGAIPLTETYYEVRVTPDSVISFLPYYGQAYFDVPYNPTDGGVKFTSTKFDYSVKQKKKGGWQIIVDPKDVKYLQRMVIDISTDGYASVSVTSTNRDFISYNGYLKE